MYLNSSYTVKNLILTCPLLYPFSFFSPSCIPYSPPSLFITRNLRFILISISSLIRCCQSMWCWIHLMPCFKRPTRRCHQCMVVSHSTSSGNSSTTSYPTSATTQLLTGINYSYVITGACVCVCVCVCVIYSFPFSYRISSTSSSVLVSTRCSTIKYSPHSSSTSLTVKYFSVQHVTINHQYSSQRELTSDKNSTQEKYLQNYHSHALHVAKYHSN